MDPIASPTSTKLIVEVPKIVKTSVEAVVVNQSMTPPYNVSVIAQGYYKNQCETIDKIQQTRNGNEFVISIESRFDDGIECGADLIPFEQAILLNIVDLSPGIYTVNVNGVRDTIRIPENTDSDPENAVLSGVVWLDSCPENQTNDSVADNTIAGHCIDVGGGVLQPNGELDQGESLIEGVVVNLGVGRCPSKGLASTLTDTDGTFVFGGLWDGTYCVSIDANDYQNRQLLIDGQWTFSDSDDVAETELKLKRSQTLNGINFGWQQVEVQQIVLPRENPCSNKALFMEDVTIPDGTVLNVGQVFTKTWKLRNIGSCSWGEGYDLVLSEGDKMDAPLSVPLPAEVHPGEDISLSVTLTAPSVPATYEAGWKLRTQAGVLFGIGPGSNQAFSVKIVVERQE